MKVADYPCEDRPRERLCKSGPSSLSNTELLAILLEKGTSRKNVMELSSEILAQYTIEKLSKESVNSFIRFHGMGIAKACKIVSCFELGRRLASFRRESCPMINSAEDVHNMLGPKLGLEKQEHLVGLYLDTRKRLIKEENLFQGTLDCSVIHPREIFKSALRESASAVIIVHNHPSGDSKPSREDIEITRQIAQAGDIMGIPLLDHVIIGENSYVSLKKERII